LKGGCRFGRSNIFFAELRRNILAHALKEGQQQRQAAMDETKEKK
jgi:hypothetical protein